MNTQGRFKSIAACLLIVAVALAVACAAAREESPVSQTQQQQPAPVIRLTQIPPAGAGPNRMQTIAGTVAGVNVAECNCKIVIFSRGDIFYVQPWANAPLTDIEAGGRFEAAIHLGSQYAVLLVKASYRPPATTKVLPEVGGDVLALTVVDAAAEKPVASGGKERAERKIQFSGYEWRVKSSEGKVGPGPNYFSDREENVFVDADGRLHLRITERGGQWECVEVILNRDSGYGAYRFYLASDVQALVRAPNAVLGMFTWNIGDSRHHHCEIDCEISLWDRPGDKLGQFVIQPYETPQNIARYDIPAQLKATTHTFTWRADSVFCQSLKGHTRRAAAGQTIFEHTFRQNIPPPTAGTNARINLWLLGGKAPANGRALEVIFSKFEFEPLL